AETGEMRAGGYRARDREFVMDAIIAGVDRRSAGAWSGRKRIPKP
ncbi:MAG: hypothetical protein ACI97B_004286, partial [Verrucomicrobiales bacterium]